MAAVTKSDVVESYPARQMAPQTMSAYHVFDEEHVFGHGLNLDQADPPSDAADTPPPAVAEQLSHDHVSGKLDEVRKARSEREDANRESRAHNRCSVASGHAAASRAIPTVALPATSVGEI